MQQHVMTVITMSPDSPQKAGAVNKCSGQGGTYPKLQREIGALPENLEDRLQHIMRSRSPIPVFVEHLERLLGLVGRQKALQVLQNDVTPARNRAARHVVR